MKFERMEKYYSMTAERLSELQNMALAGKKPEVLDEERKLPRGRGSMRGYRRTRTK